MRRQFLYRQYTQLKEACKTYVTARVFGVGPGTGRLWGRRDAYSCFSSLSPAVMVYKPGQF